MRGAAARCFGRRRDDAMPERRCWWQATAADVRGRLVAPQSSSATAATREEDRATLFFDFGWCVVRWWRRHRSDDEVWEECSCPACCREPTIRRTEPSSYQTDRSRERLAARHVCCSFICPFQLPTAPPPTTKSNHLCALVQRVGADGAARKDDVN